MIETFVQYMTKLQRERTIRIYVPNNYEYSSKSYPVLYMHDAQNLYDDEQSFFGSSWRMEDCLEKSGLELIVVGIDCNPEGTKRSDELTPWIIRKDINKGLSIDEAIDVGGEGDAYLDFIFHELKPYIDSTYRTIQSDTAMAGSSSGGVISTYAMCRYPSIFTRVAALSNAYWLCQQEIETLLEKSDLSDVKRFYFDVGTNEQTATFGSDVYLHSNRSVKELLDRTDVPHRFDIIEDAVHNEIAWRERFSAILRYLYEK